MANLLPGAYEVTVQNPGFQKLVETGIELFVDQTARVSLSMRMGDVSESVEVTAALAPLNTENATKGDVIVTQELQEMPLSEPGQGEPAGQDPQRKARQPTPQR